MKRFMLISILLLFWVFTSNAQNNENILKKKPFPFKLDNTPKDSLKAFKIPLLDSLDQSIDIPNAYKGNKLNLLATPENRLKDDSVILEKKLTGEGTVKMPGTNQLDPKTNQVKLNPVDIVNSAIIKK